MLSLSNNKPVFSFNAVTLKKQSQNPKSKVGNHNQNSEAKIGCWEVQNHNQNSASKVWLWCSKIKIQQPWSGKYFDNELTSSARHSISQYIAIYAISKGHQTPCTAIRREQRYHLNSAFRLSAFKGKDVIILLHVISFCIYFYLPSLDRFFFPFWKSGKSERSNFLALFNSEIGAVPTKSEHLAGMPRAKKDCYKNTFFLRRISEWNILPEPLVNLMTHITFKQEVISLHNLAYMYFDSHTVCIKVCEIPLKTEFKRNIASQIWPLETRNLSEKCLKS